LYGIEAGIRSFRCSVLLDSGQRSRLTEAIDTTTPGDRLVFHLFGALGQFERDLIRERTRAGLAVAEARGRRAGTNPLSRLTS
jgi:DNA invertase Pin-like site-specific DNA recombinase